MHRSDSEYWWFQNPDGVCFIGSRITKDGEPVTDNWFFMADEEPMTEAELESRGCLRLTRVSGPALKELRLYAHGHVSTIVNDDEGVRLVAVIVIWTVQPRDPEFQLTVNVNQGQRIRQLQARVGERLPLTMAVPPRGLVSFVTLDSKGNPLPAELTLLYCADPLDEIQIK